MSIIPHNLTHDANIGRTTRERAIALQAEMRARLPGYDWSGAANIPRADLERIAEQVEIEMRETQSEANGWRQHSRMDD